MNNRVNKMWSESSGVSLASRRPLQEEYYKGGYLDICQQFWDISLGRRDTSQKNPETNCTGDCSNIVLVMRFRSAVLLAALAIAKGFHAQG